MGKRTDKSSHVKNKDSFNFIDARISEYLEKFTTRLVEYSFANDTERAKHIARQLSVQLVKNLPEEERGTFQEGNGDMHLSQRTLNDFYVGKIGVEGTRSVYVDENGVWQHKRKKTTWEEYEVVCYEIPYNKFADPPPQKYDSEKYATLRCHVSADQVKKYYNGKTSGQCHLKVA